MQSNEQTPLVNHFDDIAHHYDKAAYIQNLSNQELLDRLQILRLKPHNIVCLGSGTATGLTPLTRLFPKARLSLVDQSVEMLRLSREQFSWKQKLFKSIQTEHALAEQTPFAADSVELVVANLLLPYVSDIKVVFDEIQRITHEQGVFCFTSFGPDTLQELQNILAQGLDTEQESAHGLQFGQLIDMHIIGDELLRAGFREPVMDVDVMTLTYSSFEQLWQELYHSGVVHGQCSAEIKAQIKHAYDAHRLPNGDYPVTYEVVYGQAWANSKQSILEKANSMRDGVVNFPLEQLRRR